jgi:hypothetical protein
MSSQHSASIASSMFPDGMSKARRRRASTPSRSPSDSRAAGARALHQEAFRSALAEPVAEHLQVADQRKIAIRFGADEEIGQCLPGEQLLLPPLQRTEAGDEVRLSRKCGEQRLGKGVDRLDPKPSARRIQHPGEQGPGALTHVGADILAEGPQFAGQLRILESYPISEPRMDAVRHLGGSRLGEGEAEDRGRVHPRQEKAKHPRGEHVSLARAGRSRKRGVVARARRAELVSRQARERFQAFRQSGFPASQALIAGEHPGDSSKRSGPRDRWPRVAGLLRAAVADRFRRSRTGGNPAAAGADILPERHMDAPGSSRRTDKRLNHTRPPNRCR